MHNLSILAISAFLQLTVIGAALGEPIILKFGHIGGPGSLYYQSGEEFARRVAKETNGAVQIALYPKSGLGSDTDVLKKLLTGEADLGLIGTPITSVSDAFAVFEMPFLVRDREHVKNFRDQLLSASLSPALKLKGYELLGMWELGFRHITNNLRPIAGPHSLRGLKLRVPNSPWRIKMFNSMGVEVVQIEYKDVNAALQAGTIHGIESTLDLILSTHVEKQQKFLSLSYHLYTPAFLVAGSAKFASLPPMTARTIERVAKEMEDWTLIKGTEIEAETIRQLQAEGLTVNECDRLAFTMQSLPIYKEYAASAPQAKASIKLIFGWDRPLSSLLHAKGIDLTQPAALKSPAQ